MKTNGIQNNNEVTQKPKKYSLAMFQKDNFSTILNDVEVFFDKKEPNEDTPSKTIVIDEAQAKPNAVINVKNEQLNATENTAEIQKEKKTTTGEKFLLLNYIMEEENLDKAVTDLRHIRFGGDESKSFKESVNKKSTGLTLNEDEIKRYSEPDKRKDKLKNIFSESIFTKSAGEKPMFRGEVQSKAFPKLDNFVNAGKKPGIVMVDDRGVSFDAPESYDVEETEIYLIDATDETHNDDSEIENYNQMSLPLSNSGEFPVFLTVLPSPGVEKQSTQSNALNESKDEPEKSVQVQKNEEQIETTNLIVNINGNETISADKGLEVCETIEKKSTGKVLKVYKTGQFNEIEDEVDSILSESISDNRGIIEKRRIVFENETGEFNSLFIDDESLLESFDISQENDEKITEKTDEDVPIFDSGSEPENLEECTTEDESIFKTGETGFQGYSGNVNNELSGVEDLAGKADEDYPEDLELLSYDDSAEKKEIEIIDKFNDIDDTQESSHGPTGVEVVSSVGGLNESFSFSDEYNQTLKDQAETISEDKITASTPLETTIVAFETIQTSAQPDTGSGSDGQVSESAQSFTGAGSEEVLLIEKPIENKYLNEIDAGPDGLQVSSDKNIIEDIKYAEEMDEFSDVEESNPVPLESDNGREIGELSETASDADETLPLSLPVETFTVEEQLIQTSIGFEASRSESGAIDSRSSDSVAIGIVRPEDKSGPVSRTDEIAREHDEFRQVTLEMDEFSGIDEFTPVSIPAESVRGNELDQGYESEVSGASVKSISDKHAEQNIDSASNTFIAKNDVNYQVTDISTQNNPLDTSIPPDLNPQSSSDDLPLLEKNDLSVQKPLENNRNIASSEELLKTLSFDANRDRDDYMDEMLIQDFDDGIRVPIDTEARATAKVVKSSEGATHTRIAQSTNQKKEPGFNEILETENISNNEVKTSDYTSIDRVKTPDVVKPTEVDTEPEFSSPEVKQVLKTASFSEDRSLRGGNPELQTKNVKIPVFENEILTPVSRLTDTDISDTSEIHNNAGNYVSKPENTIAHQKEKSKIDKENNVVVNNEKAEFKFTQEVKDVNPPIHPDRTDVPDKVIEKIMEKAVSAEDGKEIRVTYKGTEIRVREENDGIRIFIDGKDTNLMEQIKNDALNIEKMLKNQGHNLLSFEFGSSSERHHRTSSGDDETYEIDITDSNNSKNSESEANKKAAGTKSAKNNLLDFMA